MQTAGLRTVPSRTRLCASHATSFYGWYTQSVELVAAGINATSKFQIDFSGGLDGHIMELIPAISEVHSGA